MLLLAVSKYRKKIGVIYIRTRKKHSFRVIFHTKPELRSLSCAGTGSGPSRGMRPDRHRVHEKTAPSFGSAVFSWTSDKYYLLAFFLS